MKKNRDGAARAKVRGNISAKIEHYLTKRKEPTDRETAKKIGIPAATFCEIKKGWRVPTMEQRRKFAHYWNVSPLEFFSDEDDLFLHGTGAVRWHVRHELGTSDLLATRDVTEAVLAGHSPDAVARLLAGTDVDASALRYALQRVPDRVRSAFTLDVVQLVTPDPDAVEDPELAAELSAALSRLGRRPVTARVVRNVAHPDFGRDPIVPRLIARVAHRVVARCLEDYRTEVTIGIAGGMHLEAFVGSIGAATSPFPDGFDVRLTAVPLTLESFHEHRFELSDALVGQLYRRATSLLCDGVHAKSFTPFGFLVDGRVGELDTHSIVQIREQYLNLDVAVFGCGDISDDGWIDRYQRTLSFRPHPKPETDVCLHFISAAGQLIPLPNGRQPLGVPIEEIQRLASQPAKLALVLASGRSKGLPIVLVVLAGCANAVVCDAAAARAALVAIAAR